MKKNFDSALWVLLSIVFAVNLVCMPKQSYPGDPIAMREESRSILAGDGLAVSDEIAKPFGEPGQYFVRNVRDGRMYSKYGVASSILYLIPLELEKIFEGSLPPYDSAPRALYLNFLNLALSLVVAWMLYRITALYADKAWVRVTFVLMEFYTGFFWHYLRAQNTEIFQTLFFLGFFWALLRLRADDRGRTRWAAWAFILAMTLTKVSYVVLGPLFVGFQGWMLRERHPKTPWPQIATDVLRRNFIPGAWVLAVIGSVNFVKFGSPLLTGYHQWRPEIHGLNGDFTDSLYNLTFNVHWSLFLLFPTAALSLFGWPRFWREHRTSGVFILTIFFTYLVLIGLLPSWRGEMCYGPRYFLFVLTVLALPALPLIENLVTNWRARPGRSLLVGGIFLYSFFLQTQVNRYEFMAFYRLRDPLGKSLTLELSRYFGTSHWGRVNYDFTRAKDNLESLKAWADSKSNYNPEAARGYEELVRKELSFSNYYWF